MNVFIAAYVDLQADPPQIRSGASQSREGALRLLCRAIEPDSWSVALDDMPQEDAERLPLHPHDFTHHSAEQIVNAYWSESHTIAKVGNGDECWRHDAEQYALIQRRMLQP